MIILIDDRTQRQIKFTDRTGIDLNISESILDNYTDEKYEKLLAEFKNNDYKCLYNYDIIITHRSAFGDINSIVLDEIKSICKEKKKPLVFFSGGITSITYTKEPFDFLLLNSKTFYSHNIVEFINKPKHVLQLAYGNQYNISLLLNTLEKINMFIGSNLKEEDISFRKFKRETGIETINEFIEFEQPNTNVVKLKDLYSLSKDLTNQIKQQVVLNV